MGSKQQKKTIRDLKVAACRELELEEGKGGAGDNPFRV